MDRARGLAFLAVAALVAVLGACTSGSAAPPSASPATVVPVIVSSQQVVGPNRFVFSFLDAKTNAPVAKPDRTASVALIAPGETQPGTATPATFVWGIPNVSGDYVTHLTFPAAGAWKAVFITQAAGAPKEAISVAFDVQPKSTTIAIGQKAPASKTPTAADVGGDLRRLATDASPDPAFYTTSVDQAVAAHKPFVLAFATPAFCKSATCGPTLDRVKAVSKDASGVTFINVEPYKLQFTEGRLQPVLDANGQLQPVESVIEWGLLSEPMIFVVDRDGIVRASFEGPVGEDELKAAVAQVAA